MGRYAAPTAGGCRIIGAGMTCMSRVRGARRQAAGRSGNSHRDLGRSSFSGPLSCHDGAPAGGITLSHGQTSGCPR